MEPHPHRNHYRLIILTLFVGLALITIALVFYYQRSGMLRVPAAVSTQSAPVSIPTTKPTTPKKALTGVSFTLQAAETMPSYPRDSSITLNVVAESNKNTVLGYDIVIGRDEEAYDLVSVTSLLPEFTVLKFVKDTKFTITGILKPSVTKPVIFDKTPIVSVTLKPKKTGTLLLTVLMNEGSETTKIMSTAPNGTALKLPIDVSSTLRLDID
jgi:flagellar basal body-associated protein FliL